LSTNKSEEVYQLATENGINTIDDITNHHIKGYLVSLPERGLKANSQHDYARAVKTFLNYCVRDERARPRD